MCDVDAYATGLLLTQISVGLLTSALLNVASGSANTPVIMATAVEVVEANVEPAAQNVEEGVSDAASLQQPDQALRRRVLQGGSHRRNELVTISVHPEVAKKMKFDF